MFGWRDISNIFPRAAHWTDICYRQLCFWPWVERYLFENLLSEPILTVEKPSCLHPSSLSSRLLLKITSSGLGLLVFDKFLTFIGLGPDMYLQSSKGKDQAPDELAPNHDSTRSQSEKRHAFIACSKGSHTKPWKAEICQPWKLQHVAAWDRTGDLQMRLER